MLLDGFAGLDLGCWEVCAFVIKHFIGHCVHDLGVEQQQQNGSSSFDLTDITSAEKDDLNKEKIIYWKISLSYEKNVSALQIARCSLLLKRQQAVNHIHNRLLQGSELDAQLSNGLGSVDLVDGRKSSSGVALGRPVLQLGELFADDVANLLVAVGGVGNQVSLAGGLWLLEG